MKILLKIVGVALIVASLGFAGLVAANWKLARQIATFSPFIMPAINLPAKDAAEANLQDIRYLRKLIKYDRSYSASEKTEFERFLDDAEARAPTMSQAEIYLTAARAAAITDNGHTNVSLTPVTHEFDRIGARFFWFKDGLYIVRADAPHGDLVGARVTNIEGRPIADAMSRLEFYFGGAPQWRRYLATMLFEAPAALQAAGLAASADSVSFSVIDANDVERSVRFEAKANAAPADVRRRPWMTLDGRPLADEADTWARTLTFDSEDSKPLYLRETQQPYVSFPLPGGLYLRTQITFDVEPQTIDGFFSAAFDGISDKSLDYLVYDLRWNPGGDLNTMTDIVKWLPNKVRDDGAIYIVTGPQTFSAAIVTVAFLKYYGGDRSLIVGSPAGDTGIFWAERGLPFKLPNSKYSVSYATGFHDWEHGDCSREKYCFTQVSVHGVPAGPLTPDVRIEPTYADYASGRDVVMDWILSRERGQENAN